MHSTLKDKAAGVAWLIVLCALVWGIMLGLMWAQRAIMGLQPPTECKCECGGK